MACALTSVKYGNESVWRGFLMRQCARLTGVRNLAILGTMMPDHGVVLNSAEVSRPTSFEISQSKGVTKWLPMLHLAYGTN